MFSTLLRWDWGQDRLHMAAIADDACKPITLADIRRKVFC